MKGIKEGLRRLGNSQLSVSMPLFCTKAITMMANGSQISFFFSNFKVLYHKHISYRKGVDNHIKTYRNIQKLSFPSYAKQKWCPHAHYMITLFKDFFSKYVLNVTCFIITHVTV